MRLDKFFTTTATLTRSRAQKEIRSGHISVNGITIKNPDFHIDPENDEVVYDGNKITYSKFIYIIMNKPRNVVSATTDVREKTVLDLLPDGMRNLGLFPCGRLDKDTTGLVILTNDGVAAHNALSPKRHVKKLYRFTVADPYSDEDILSIEQGITLKDGYTTKPCKIKRIDICNGYITLTEGKYHEIKRLFGARGNKIISLSRESFGNVNIGNLSDGEWRFMSEEEISTFTQV
mgnify:FL=1